MKTIAITGGIGAGKSVVCRIVSCWGFPVYDCDINARRIMDSDPDIKRRIAHEISAYAIADGEIDRQRLAAVVFAEPAKLAKLNEIVHGAVRHDLSRWISSQMSDMVFVETAILYQSALDKMVDEVWEVDAPEHVRIERVCWRNGIDADAVKARIESQRVGEYDAHPHVRAIINDDCHSLLLQLAPLLG